ncbi:MAG: AAA family ATPase [Pseudomonadales bacterium]|nr:AAA family ATPase [Pseudomonadales bacterium]
MSSVIRSSVEYQYASELEILKENDKGISPPGWYLSAISVKKFILGDDTLSISRKFYGDDALVERAIVTLMGYQALLLVGEPGTAKSLLSELLSAAICGDSQKIIQGTAGTTEDHIKYAWNYALLLSDGPSKKSLIPTAILKAMQTGSIARFEEITRCPQEIQDAMISLLSEKQIMIPELSEVQSALPGFNIIATANLHDKGVNEMSSALKRRFNFETVLPIRDKEQEKTLIMQQVSSRLQSQSLDVKMDNNLLDILVTTFSELRGNKESGVKSLDAVLSTAEAVNIAYACTLQTYYVGTKPNSGQIAEQMQGTIIKDKVDDRKKLAHYLDLVIRERVKKDKKWKSFLDTGKLLWMKS